MRLQGFIGASYTLRSYNVDCQRTVNLFLEQNEMGTGKEGERFALLPTPGLTTLLTLSKIGFRGLYTASNGILYAVCGNGFYSIASSWTATLVGTLLTSSGTVKMSDNGSELVAVDGTYGYFYTFGNTYTAQVDTITVNSLTGVPGHAYAFTINGTAISYTSVTGDSYFSILTGLNLNMQANNVPSTGSVTGTGASAVLTITANAAGTPNTYTAVDSELTQANTVPNGIAGPTFQQITDAAFAGADVVDYLDGYFVFNKPGTQQFYISSINDVTFNGLDFASAEANPDLLVSLIVVNRNVWLFGTRTTEIWYDSGAADFPLARIEGAFLEVGCAAKFSPAKLGNTVFWIGQAEEGLGVVYMANGFAPERISTHAVEDAIAGYGDISGATSYCYQEDGHGFYVLNFPSASTTWVYDMGSKAWHERAYLNPTSGQFERHRGECHAYAYNTHVLGDYATGDLYHQDKDAESDFGNAIARLRAAPHITAGLSRVRYDRFQLDIEAGVGLDGTQQGTDPQVVMQFSDDGGHTWSNEKWASMGKIGAYRWRAIWRRLGMSRDRVFRVKVTDPVKVVFIGAEVEMERMAS